MKFYNYINEKNLNPPAGTLVQTQGDMHTEYFLKLFNGKWEMVKANISPKINVIVEFSGDIIDQGELSKKDLAMIFQGSNGKEINGLPDLYSLPIGSKLRYEGVDIYTDYKKIDRITWISSNGNKVDTIDFKPSIWKNLEITKIGKKEK